MQTVGPIITHRWCLDQGQKLNTDRRQFPMIGLVNLIHLPLEAIFLSFFGGTSYSHSTSSSDSGFLEPLVRKSCFFCPSSSCYPSCLYFHLSSASVLNVMVKKLDCVYLRGRMYAHIYGFQCMLACALS